MLCRYSEFSLKKGICYENDMNKQRLSYSGRLHPLSVSQRLAFGDRRKKKQPGENLSNGVDAGI